MIKRVVTGVVLAAIAICMIVLQGWFFYAAMAVLMLLSFHEMYSALTRHGDKPVQWPGYLFCVLSVLAAAFHKEAASFAGKAGSVEMLILLVCAMLGISCVILRGKVDYPAFSASVMPMLYPGIFYVAMLKMPQLGGRMVVTLVLFMSVFVASMNDCFALFVGIKFGKHKLSPEISPKKSIEGSVGGLVAAMVFSVVLPIIAKAIWAGTPDDAILPPWWAFAIVGLIAGAFSQVGDLAASLIKRHCGVKDFGKLFPGHGGMLDRLDGVLFCSVIYYVFFALFV